MEAKFARIVRCASKCAAWIARLIREFEGGYDAFQRMVVHRNSLFGLCPKNAVSAGISNSLHRRIVFVFHGTTDHVVRQIWLKTAFIDETADTVWKFFVTVSVCILHPYAVNEELTFVGLIV